MKTLVVTVDVLRLQAPATLDADSLRRSVSAELGRSHGAGRAVAPERPIPRLTARSEPGPDAAAATARALAAVLRRLLTGER